MICFNETLWNPRSYFTEPTLGNIDLWNETVKASFMTFNGRLFFCTELNSYRHATSNLTLCSRRTHFYAYVIDCDKTFEQLQVP